MNGKRVLMNSPTPVYPRGAGNRARVEMLVRTLLNAGYRLHFLHIEQEPGDREAMRLLFGEGFHHVPYRRPNTLSMRFRKRLSQLRNRNGVHDYRIDDWWDPAADAFIRALHAQFRFDAVIVEYVFYSRALLNFRREVVKVIDSHDMFTNRHRRYLAQGQKPQWFSTSAKQEGAGFDRADRVIAISEGEATEFSRMTRAEVVTIGHLVEHHSRQRSRVVPGTILFVASENPINVHGIRWFLDEVYGDVQARRPGVELWIAGSITRGLAAQPGVKLLGRVDDLEALYASANVVINPVRFMTGLSIKNLEALSFGCPLVTAPAGAAAMREGAGRAFLVGDTPQEFIRQVDSILASPEIAETLGHHAGKLVEGWNEQAKQRLFAALEPPATAKRA